jgi:hypothetical protein
MFVKLSSVYEENRIYRNTWHQNVFMSHKMCRNQEFSPKNRANAVRSPILPAPKVLEAD